MVDDADGTENHGNFKFTDPSIIATSVDGVDDWGEFLSGPCVWNPTSSLPNNLESSMNPIEYESSNRFETVTAQVRKDSNPIRWDKPRGAIPLSIFGMEEEDEKVEEVANALSSATFGNETGTTGEGRDDTEKFNYLHDNLPREDQKTNGVENGFDKLHESEMEIPKQVNNIDFSSWNAFMTGNEVARETINDASLTTNCSVLTHKLPDWNLHEGASVASNGNACENGLSPVVIDSAQNANGVEYSKGDEDDDDIGGWQFKIAETKWVAEENKTNDTKPLTEEKTIIDGMDSSWSSLRMDFGGSKSDDISATTSWFSEDRTTEQRKPNGNHFLQFHEADTTGQSKKFISLDDNEPGISRSSNFNHLVPGVRDDMFEPAGISLTISSIASRNDLDVGNVAEAHDASEVEEWNFQSAQLESEQSSWNILDSNGAMEKKVENSTSGGLGDDLWAHDLWDIKAAKSEESINDSICEGSETNKASVDKTATSTECETSLFASSNVTWHNSGDWNFTSSPIPSSETENKGVPDMMDRDNIEVPSFSSLSDGQHTGEKSWAFFDTNVGDVSVDKGDVVSPRNKKALPLPLSIFGEEEAQFDTPVHNAVPLSDISTSKSNVGSKIYDSNVSINYIVSNLYELGSTPVFHTGDHNEDGRVTPASLVSINLLGEVDNMEDGSWEFQDASVENNADSKSSFTEFDTNKSNDGELDEYINFFVQLKEKLILVAQFHHENHKESGSTDSIDLLLKEFNGVGIKIHNIETDGEEVTSNARGLEETFSDILPILNDSKFQLFETEYSFSTTLLKVENDLHALIELFKVVKTILTILTVVASSSHRKFVSAWCQILVACAKELRHGASIWTRAAEVNAHHKLLDDPRGKEFIMSLGEIYRVVEIVRLSTKVCKPWFCANPSLSNNLFAFLDECSSLWASSGLQDPFKSLREFANPTLLESIDALRGMDVNTLYDSVLSGKYPICQLSLLPANAVPGMHTVLWNGKNFFLCVANLWANLVAPRGPPMLPSVHFALGK